MIIITRPSPYGEELTQLCHQANLPVKYLPLFKIESGKDLNSLQQHLNSLSPGDVVIVTSPQIVHTINDAKLSFLFPSDVHYFAVGQHTALLFETISQQPVKSPKQQENSEGLIETLANLKIPIVGRKILLLCGDVGRNVIKQSLIAQNSFVSNICIYHREPIDYSHSIFKDHEVKKQFVITSVDHLLRLGHYCDNNNKMNDTLIVSAKRIAQEAMQQGWQHIYLAENANNQNLFKTISSLCHNTVTS